jgi:hypothetical protein
VKYVYNFKLTVMQSDFMVNKMTKSSQASSHVNLTPHATILRIKEEGPQQISYVYKSTNSNYLSHHSLM